MLPYVSNPAYSSMRQTTIRFEHILLLHDRGDSPNGDAKALEEELRRYYPATTFGAELFRRPLLPHSRADVSAEQSLAALKAQPVPEGAALVGLGWGGLIAAKLQEQGREDLHVICVGSPAEAAGFRLERRMPDRVAFYFRGAESANRGFPDWPRLAQAFDLPWLAEGLEVHLLAIARLVFAYLDGDSLPHAIADVERF